jgi:hypothetical protein
MNKAAMRGRRDIRKRQSTLHHRSQLLPTPVSIIVGRDNDGGIDHHGRRYLKMTNFPGNAENSSRAVESIDQIVDPLRQLDVRVGYSAGIVGGEFENHPDVPDDDLRMMLRFLDNLGNAVHKIDRVIELFELDNPGDGFLFVLPLRALFQSGFQIVFF